MSPRTQSERRGLDLAAWAGAIAEIVEYIDDDSLPQRLLDAIRALVPFELASSVVYSGRGKPTQVCDTFVDLRAKQGLANYVNSTYVLNPTYSAYLRGLKGGVYRIRELAPDAYFESQHHKSFKVTLSESEEIGYVTHDWPRGMEEAVVAIELPDGDLGEISLLQPVRLGGFSDRDLELLRAIEPMIGSVYRRYWFRVRPVRIGAWADTAIDEAFARFGGDALSPREREVAQLLLRGHSTLSVSSHLGICATTVKTHRKNLYGKLGIATQFELFSLFIDSLSDGAAKRPAVPDLSVLAADHPLGG